MDIPPRNSEFWKDNTYCYTYSGSLGKESRNQQDLRKALNSRGIYPDPYQGMLLANLSGYARANEVASYIARELRHELSVTCIPTGKEHRVFALFYFDDERNPF